MTNSTYFVNETDSIALATYGEYLFYFGIYRDGFHDISVRRALTEDGGLYFYYRKGRPIAFLAFSSRGRSKAVLDIFTISEYRNLGVGQSLLTNGMALVGKGVYWRILITDNYGDTQALRHLCEKLGFRLEITSHIYSCHNVYQDQVIWEKFMAERGNAISDFWKRAGYQAYTLEDAPEELREQLLHVQESSFATYLDPNTVFHLATDKEYPPIGTLVAKDGILEGYVLISRLGEADFIIEQQAVSKRMRGRGLFLLILDHALRQMPLKPETRLNYVVYDNNQEMESLRKKLFYMIPSSERICWNYGKWVE